MGKMVPNDVAMTASKPSQCATLRRAGRRFEHVWVYNLTLPSNTFTHT